MLQIFNLSRKERTKFFLLEVISTIQESQLFQHCIKNEVLH